MRAPSRCRRLLGALALASCTLHGIRLSRAQRDAEHLPPALAARIADLGHTIADHAIKPPAPALLAAGALKGLAWGADDPYTAVLDDRGLATRTSGLAGRYGGLGIVVAYEERAPRIEIVHAGGPAAAAGLLPDDRISAIDGQPTGGVDALDLRVLLRGTPGSVVTLEVWREAGARSIVATATRALVHVPSAVRIGWLERSRGIATVALAVFQERTAEECERALAGLEAEAPVRGLALDLRGNVGGLIGEARQVAGLFTDARIVATVARRGALTGEDITTPPDHCARWPALPLAVLIDRDSASASEILAGALADHRRALIVGERSYGKALIQDTVQLAGAGALTLSVARYYTPAGQRIHKDRGVRGGIAPDLSVPTGTLARARLRERWRERAIADSGVFAPGWTPRNLADPVLDAALAALLGERVVVRTTGE